MQWLAYVGFLAQLVWFAQLGAGAVLAVYVYRHSSKVVETTLDFPPGAWAVMVLASPALGVLVYWLVHRHARPRVPAADIT